jgi:hypothetical protein
MKKICFIEIRSYKIAVPSTDKIKAESDMNITVNGEKIEFTTFRDFRIKVNLSDL